MINQRLLLCFSNALVHQHPSFHHLKHLNTTIQKGKDDSKI